MEDLVRFLNFESGNFYRNRDLVLIFKRFTNEASDQKSEKALDIEKILKVIASWAEWSNNNIQISLFLFFH